MEAGIVRRRFGRTIIITLSVFIGSFFLYTLIDRLCTIQSIEIVGSGISVQIDEKKISRNLLFFPSDTLRTKILQDNPLLSDVQFQKQFPHTLRIVPIVRVPFATLKTTDRLVVLDKTGVVIKEGDTTVRLPELTFPLQNVHVGEHITDERVLQSLRFIEGVASLFIIRQITDDGSGSLLAKSEKTDIYLPQDRPIEGIIATLQTLTTGFRIKGTLPTVVDLRFDKPIVKF